MENVHNEKYRRSSDSADSISAVPGLVRIANCTILPKIPDLVRFANHYRPAQDLKIPLLGELDQFIEQVVNLGSDQRYYKKEMRKFICSLLHYSSTTHYGE